VSLDESVLDDIERVVLVAQHAERQCVGPPVVALEQRLERVAIAALRGGDQLAVIDRIASMRRDGRNCVKFAGGSYNSFNEPYADF
jgi:hypothetical protein